jgi:hypothetical protein
MRNGISFTVSAADRQRLHAVIADPKSPQKHVWRARMILLSDGGLGTSAIMAEAGKSKTCVWRWQERLMCKSPWCLTCGKRSLAPMCLDWHKVVDSAPDRTLRSLL